MSEDKGFMEVAPRTDTEEQGSSLESLKSSLKSMTQQDFAQLGKPGMLKRLTGRSLQQWFDELANQDEKANLSGMEAHNVSNSSKYAFKAKVVYPKLEAAYPQVRSKPAKPTTIAAPIQATNTEQIIDTTSPIVDTALGIGRLKAELSDNLSKLSAYYGLSNLLEERNKVIKSQLYELRERIIKLAEEQ